MVRLLLNSLTSAALLAACQSPTSPGGTSTAQGGRSVWVEPATGSHLGGGFVRVPSAIRRGEEAGLLDAIQAINDRSTNQNQQVYVLEAISQVSGASQQQSLTQRNQTNFRFSELLAFNLLPRNDDAKARQLAAVRASGKSWTQLASSNGSNINALAQKSAAGEQPRGQHVC